MVEAHAITVLKTIAARGLSTVGSLQVQDFKAMLQDNDPEAPGAMATRPTSWIGSWRWQV
jgi:hypothetical protein